MKMRAFIVFSTFVITVTLAAPQGYNYNAPAPAPLAVGVQPVGPPAVELAAVPLAPAGSPPSGPGQAYLAPGAPGAVLTGAAPAPPASTYLPGGHGAQKPEIVVSKHFYVHSGPDYHDTQTRNVDLGPPKKHYRVIFIKPPSFTSNAALSINAQPTEEKTFIYVLSQKTDLGEITTDVRTPDAPPSKPEVFFIKYRTPEEAAYAQREIQAQYDALGGVTQFTEEGLAPVQNYIGSLGQVAESYLPPSY